MSRMVEYVKDFISLQIELVSLLLEKYNDCKDLKFLTDFPKRGTLLLNGVEWNFIKHGAGFLFINNESRVEIDARRDISMMHAFDVNRIEQYLESIGLDVDSIEEAIEAEIAMGTITYEDVEYKLLKLSEKE